MKVIWYILVSMRPRQWIKNSILFAGLVFSLHFLETDLIIRSVSAFILFCLLAGSIYLINDVFDREKDRQHPSKKDRPIASGKLGTGTAATVGVILIIFSLISSWYVGVEFFWSALAFVAVNSLYSAVLREMVILDVISIAFSFLIRAVAGVAALESRLPGIELSPWLLICTLFLSLFLAISKRRYENRSLLEAGKHRRPLKEYSANLLDQLIVFSATASVISYSIYTVWPQTVEKFQTDHLVYTIPFVVFGIMRYLYLVYTEEKGGDPSRVLIMEKAILIDVFAWFVAVLWILSRSPMT